MKKLNKDEMDQLATEVFAQDEYEDIDLGFDPADVVRGNPDAVEKFKKLHEAAKEK